MLISYRHTFLFIHVYKVAGTSVRDALEPYADKAPLPARALKRYLKVNLPHHRWRVFPHHIRASQVQALIPPAIYNSFFKFAFVRNPWDWQVSLYHFMQQYERHKQLEVARRLHTFEDYLHWRVSEDLHLQQEFVTDASGKLIVDYVGRLETIGADFAQICRTIGIDAQLKHMRKSAHKDYRSYYTDRTAALVEQHFKQDIERFGYTFDGIAGPTAAHAEPSSKAQSS